MIQARDATANLPADSTNETPDGPPRELPAPARSRARRAVDELGTPLLLLVEAIVILGTWQLAATTFELVSPAVLPPPTDVLGALVDLAARGELWTALLRSTQHWGSGFALAVGVGIVLGLVTGLFRVADHLVSPFLWSLYATPWISFLPMLAIWFGFGGGPIIMLVFIVGVLPIALTTAAGARTADQSLIRAARVFGCNWPQVQWKVRLPATVPFVVTGLRIAIPLSIIAMLVGEILGADGGIGKTMAIAASTYNLAESFAAIFVTVVISATLVAASRSVEKKLAGWRAEAGRG